jgi:hypothetical protein
MNLKLEYRIKIVRKEAEIEEHKQLCHVQGCKEILVKEIELQLLKDRLKEIR